MPFESHIYPDAEAALASLVRIGMRPDDAQYLVRHEKAHYERAKALGFCPVYVFDINPDGPIVNGMIDFKGREPHGQDLIDILLAPDEPGEEDLMIVRREQYEHRLKQVLDATPSNCYGTALYLGGVIDEDRVVDVEPAQLHYFENLEILRTPEPYCFVGFMGPMPSGLDFLEGEFLYHLAVLTATDPKRITHRNGNNGSLFKNELLDDVIAREIKDQTNMRLEYRRFPVSTQFLP